MVRNYDPARPVPPEIVDELLDHAIHAPSAGFSQGWAFLVLDEPEAVARFWTATTPPGSGLPSGWLAGMAAAPVIIVPLSSKDVYLDRYAEADKGWTDRDPGRWSAPYWWVDAGMASMLTLLAAVDSGLGAGFFGIPIDRVSAVRATFGIPDEQLSVGVISIGYPDPTERPSGSRGRRPRKPRAQLIHRGRWG